MVSDLVPLWQPVVTITAQTETISPRHLAALLQSTTDRLERVAATTEYLVNRGEEITRVAEQVANLGERIESLRTTLQHVENDRTTDLRHELRIIGRLAGATVRTATGYGPCPIGVIHSANSTSGQPSPTLWAGW